MNQATYNAVSVTNQQSKMFQKFKNHIRVYTQNLMYFILTPYLILKHVSNHKSDANIFQKCMLLLKSIGLFLIISTLILVLGLYKKIVEIILTWKLGDKFLQIIAGPDALLSCYDDTSGLISVLLQIETTKTSDELFVKIKQRVYEHFFKGNVNRKYFSIKNIFMGQMYLEHIKKIGIDDVLIKMNDELLHNSDEVIYTNSTKRSPMNGLFNWDILFYTQPYKILKNEKKVYVIQMRMHHLLADGIVIYNMLTTLFTDDRNPKDNHIKSMNTPNSSETFRIKNLKNFKNLGIVPNNLIYNGLTNSETTCYLFCEETGEYFNKIKAIKSKFKGVSFLSVLMAAYSASLSKYFIENYSDLNDVIENISLVTPVQMNKKRITKYYSGKKCEEMTNDFSLCLFKIPIVPKGKFRVPLEDYMIERLELIKKEFEMIGDSSDIPVIYLLMKTIVNVMPYSLAKSLDPPIYTGVVSQVPGGPELPTFTNDSFHSVTYFLPRLPHYGIAFYLATYGDRLNITLVGDKNKFATKEDLMLVIQNLLKYLDVLYDQTKNIEKL